MKCRRTYSEYTTPRKCRNHFGKTLMALLTWIDVAKVPASWRLVGIMLTSDQYTCLHVGLLFRRGIETPSSPLRHSTCQHSYCTQFESSSATKVILLKKFVWRWGVGTVRVMANSNIVWNFLIDNTFVLYVKFPFLATTAITTP